MRRLTPDRFEDHGPPMPLGTAPVAVRPAPPPAVDPDEQKRALQRAFDEARERGLAEGMKDAGREVEKRVATIETRLREEHGRAMQQLQSERARLESLSAGLSGALDRHAQAQEAVSVEVAYAALVRVLGDKAANRSLMVDLCRIVVRDFGLPPATLRVCESDLALLEGTDLGIPVEADRRLSPGQCVIETPRGQFESGLDVRLDAVRRALLASLAEGGGSA